MAEEKLTVEKIRNVRDILNANDVSQDDRMMGIFSESCGMVFLMGNGDIRLPMGEKLTDEQHKAVMEEFCIQNTYRYG